MKRLFFAGICVLFALNSIAQAPQAFKYQAVVRDALGNPIVSQTIAVKISILQDSINGNSIFTELHHPLTNAYGVINVNVGQGSLISGNFSNIDWANHSFFLKLEIDNANGTNYIHAGTSQLLSVPYALFAGSSLSGQWNQTGNDIYNSNSGNVGIGTNTPNSKLEVQGTSSLPNDTLFQVKDNQGRPVFMVFPDGAQIVLPESNRAAAGGFAVSGRSSARPFNTDLIRVTLDSVRIYIDEDNNRAAAGGFAVSGRSSARPGLKNYLNVSIDTSETIIPSKPRVLWYPTKEAFLAGRVYIPHRDSIGRNSLSIGFETKAVGNFSQALGFKAKSIGAYSMSIGKGSLAGGVNSFAFGAAAKAEGNDSYAIGAGSIASGSGSFAFGSIGRDTLGNIIGFPTTAAGQYAFAFGLGALANDIGSLSLGANTLASGKFSLAMGVNSEASNTYAAAIGVGANASALSSMAIGPQAIASANNAIAMGYHSTASGLGSFAIGFQTTASNVNTTAIGFYSNATGRNATAIGNGTVAQSFSSTALGCFNTISGDLIAWLPNDPLFTIGNGTNELNRSDALVILKNSNTGINNSDPKTTLDINGGLSIRKANENITVYGPLINSEIYNVTATFIKVTGPTTAFNIGGIYGGVDGRIVMLYNATTQTMTIKPNQTTSLPANRIITHTGGNVDIAPNRIANFIYDIDLNKWIMISYL